MSKDRPMNDAIADTLGRYSRGELTSKAVMQATGLNYAQVLDGLGALGLRLPRPNLDGPDGAHLREGYDRFLSYLLDHKRRQEQHGCSIDRAAGVPDDVDRPC